MQSGLMNKPDFGRERREMYWQEANSTPGAKAGWEAVPSKQNLSEAD